MEALTKHLSVSNVKVRSAAAQALGALGPAAATPEILAALLKRLTDSKENMRHAAAEALGALGPAAATPEILAALLKRLTDSEWLGRYVAAGALKNLSLHVRSQDRPQAVKLFLSLTRRADEICRQTGYSGLRNLLAAKPQ